MKRRNAETGKMRRPIKRTKITEGMYGNSMLYLKFVMLWSTVVVADHMLEFRFEFLWPFWMMFRSLYDSFKYQGVAFSVFFICIALTSDMICFFYIPMPWMLIAACTYVWVQCLWYTVADKGLCLPTVALCCVIAYVEGAVRAAERSGGELCRPFAAHCVGYPVVSLGFGFKSYVGARLRLRKQQQMREDNEYYFHLMRETLPDAALDEPQEPSSSQSRLPSNSTGHREGPEPEHKHMNGSTLKHRKCVRPDLNHILEHATLQYKLDKLEKHLSQQQTAPGCAGTATDLDKLITQDTCRGSTRSRCDRNNKETYSVREERRRHKNRDKDKEKEISEHSHKSTEQTKDKEPVKEIESTKSCCNHTNKEKERDKEKEKEIQRDRDNESHKERDREKDMQREKERELHRERERAKELQREREKEKDREREVQRERERERELHRERERELQREREKDRELHRERERELRECNEELKRVKAELVSLRSSEAAAAKARSNEHKCSRAAAAAAAASAAAAAATERATLERRVQEERRARVALEHRLTVALHHTGECENEECAARRASAESEAGALRRELQRARDRASRLARDRAAAADQIRTLSQRQEENGSPHSRLASAFQSLQERATHLERSLSAETRVKLDLLSALGEAKRHLQLQETLIAKQEKEMQELKAQMLAVMPSEFLAPLSAAGSKLRLSDGSHLDPNASVYTPKQLCSDA